MGYTAFRKALLADGFLLWGPELFIRTTQDRRSAEKHLRRMEDYNPKTGTIRVLLLTERQFSAIRCITDIPDLQEQDVGRNEIVMV